MNYLASWVYIYSKILIQTHVETKALTVLLCCESPMKAGEE